MTADTRHRLRLLHAQGLTGSEIARQLGVSRQRVSQLRSEMNLKCEQPREVRRRQVANLIGEGHCIEAMAKILRVSPFTLYRDLSDVPLPRPLQDHLDLNIRNARNKKAD